MLTSHQPIGTVAYMGGVWAVPEEFTWAWGQMIQYNNEFLCEPGQYVHLDRAKTSYHSAARNRLAQGFLGDWLLQLDTDHVFDPDLCARMVGLIRSWDVDVLTAVYRYKEHPYLPNLFGIDPASPGQTFVKLVDIDWDSPLCQIGCSGAGTLLVRRKVFDQIRAELKEEPFDIIPPFSEDFSFYRRCLKLGIKTYVAPRIYSAHLRAHAVQNEDFDRDAVAFGPLSEPQKTLDSPPQPA